MRRVEGVFIWEWLAGFARTTSRSYMYDALAFLAAVDKPLEAIETEDILRHMREMVHTRSAATCRRRINVIRSLFRYARQRGYVQSDPAAAVRLRRTIGENGTEKISTFG